MKSLAALLSLAVLGGSAAAADGAGAQIPAPNANTQTPGVPSIRNPGSTQSPSPTPGTEFPSPDPTAPHQTGTFQAPRPGQRTRAQILTDVRSSVMQTPETARVQDLRVFRRGGRIILTGTVATQAEKDAAGARAVEAAGGQTVINQLEVK